MRYFRDDLSKRLLSADFKKQVDGMEMLHKVSLMQSYFSHYFLCAAVLHTLYF